MDGRSQRLDQALFERGLCESRTKAKALIIAGEVEVDGHVVTSPSAAVRASGLIEVRQPPPFVSRGGLKLEKALDAFGIDLSNRACADLGASTGGFTDCMLQRGASSVLAVDVGYGQLAWKLRNDPRVTVLERTNARYLEPLADADKKDFASMDLSFISLLQVLPAAIGICREDADFLALIKPQFEAGREKVGKKGVVRDADVHREVIGKVMRGAKDLGLGLCGLTFSPIKGPNGNIEFLGHFKKNEPEIDDQTIDSVVRQAHAELGS